LKPGEKHSLEVGNRPATYILEAEEKDIPNVKL
jgi:hypothetical protein